MKVKKAFLIKSLCKRVRKSSTAKQNLIEEQEKVTC